MICKVEQSQQQKLRRKMKTSVSKISSVFSSKSCRLAIHASA